MISNEQFTEGNYPSKIVTLRFNTEFIADVVPLPAIFCNTIIVNAVIALIYVRQCTHPYFYKFCFLVLDFGIPTVLLVR